MNAQEELAQYTALKLTPDHALRIEELRKTESWRTLAWLAWEEWENGRDWGPRGNQLVGMALCKAASEILGRDVDDGCNVSGVDVPVGFSWHSSAELEQVKAAMNDEDRREFEDACRIHDGNLAKAIFRRNWGKLQT